MNICPQLIVLMLSMVLASSALGEDTPGWSQTVQTARTDHQALVKALEERLPSMNRACASAAWSACDALTPPVRHPTGYGLYPRSRPTMLTARNRRRALATLWHGCGHDCMRQSVS